jgi:hypothetical protein
MDIESIAPILEDIIRQSLYEKRYQFGFANYRGTSNKVASGTLARSVEVQERLATICLLANKKFNCLNFNSFLIGASTTPFNKFYNESVISDALKRAYAQTGNQIYLNEFSSLRDSIIQKLSHPIEEQA